MVFALPGQRGRGPSLAKKNTETNKIPTERLSPKPNFWGNMTYAYEVEEEHGSINYDLKS